MTDGTLRIYLGAAPGVGKTFAMLNEGQRRASRGTDVVIGLVETHDRPHTIAQISDLEIVPRKRVSYRGTELEEMDLDAILQRMPAVVLIDELAHTNAPGSKNEKRYQDVAEILRAGIDVITTVNIQHLESVNDIVESVTGIRQLETVPDVVVRSADQIELVDMSPEALRRRMAHGNIYKPEKVDAALSNFFREGNLSALRELALLWVADRVDDALRSYRNLHGIDSKWETKERVLVAVTGEPNNDNLVRRAARIAQRARADFLAVRVRSESGLRSDGSDDISEIRDLVVGLGGDYREIVGFDIARTVVDFAKSESVTQIVIGQTKKSRLREFVEGSVVNSVVRATDQVDVHIIGNSTDEKRNWRLTKGGSDRISRRRIGIGFLAAVVLPALLTVFFVSIREHVNLGTEMTVYVLAVLIAAGIGGWTVALTSALFSSFLINYWLTPPYNSLAIHERANTISYLTFIVVAIVTGLLVSSLGRQTVRARQAQAKSETLTSIITKGITADDSVQFLLDQMVSTFHLNSASLSKNGEAIAVSFSGEHETILARSSSETFILSGSYSVDIYGPPISGGDRNFVQAFVGQIEAAIERDQLVQSASKIVAFEEADKLRTAIVRSVSHDFRSPLSAIKASVSSLKADDVEWTDQARREFLDAIEIETDRLNALVGNLLDMSRLESGAMQIQMQQISLDEAVSSAIRYLQPSVGQIEVVNLEDIEDVVGDAALLERVLVNVIDNSIRHGQSETPIHIDAGKFGDQVQLRIVDRGRGILPQDKSQVFEPFQRLGDSSSNLGLGLGLAVAKGFITAMNGELLLEDTPGGGVTVVINLDTWK